MIKPVLRYCIPIYLIIGGILLALVRKGNVSLAALSVLLILIVCIIVLGLLLGMIISVLIRKPSHEVKFYWIGQLVSFALIATPFARAMVDSSPKRSNSEQNDVTIREVTDTTSRQFVLPAFDSLKLKFKSPDDLELNSVTSVRNDDGVSVYFAYNLLDNHDKEYYSKYKVKNGEAKLVQFNLDTRSTIEYLHVYRQQEAMKDTLRKYEKMIK